MPVNIQANLVHTQNQKLNNVIKIPKIKTNLIKKKITEKTKNYIKKQPVVVSNTQTTKTVVPNKNKIITVQAEPLKGQSTKINSFNRSIPDLQIIKQPSVQKNVTKLQKTNPVKINKTTNTTIIDTPPPKLITNKVILNKTIQKIKVANTPAPKPVIKKSYKKVKNVEKLDLIRKFKNIPKINAKIKAITKSSVFNNNIKKRSIIAKHTKIIEKKPDILKNTKTIQKTLKRRHRSKTLKKRSKNDDSPKYPDIDDSDLKKIESFFEKSNDSLDIRKKLTPLNSLKKKKNYNKINSNAYKFSSKLDIKMPKFGVKSSEDTKSTPKTDHKKVKRFKKTLKSHQKVSNLKKILTKIHQKISKTKKKMLKLHHKISKTNKKSSKSLQKTSSSHHKSPKLKKTSKKSNKYLISKKSSTSKHSQNEHSLDENSEKHCKNSSEKQSNTSKTSNKKLLIELQSKKLHHKFNSSYKLLHIAVKNIITNIGKVSHKQYYNERLMKCYYLSFENVKMKPVAKFDLCRKLIGEVPED